MTKNVRDFKCELCSYKTIKNSRLASHVKTVHLNMNSSNITSPQSPPSSVPSKVSEVLKNKVGAGLGKHNQDVESLVTALKFPVQVRPDTAIPVASSVPPPFLNFVNSNQCGMKTEKTTQPTASTPLPLVTQTKSTLRKIISSASDPGNEASTNLGTQGLTDVVDLPNTESM